MKNLLYLLLLLTACISAQNKADCIDPSKIEPDAMCYELFKPVCGCDGKTYSNDCVATKNGVTSFTEGECDTQPSQK